MIEAIKKRTSVRTYNGEPLGEKEKKKVREMVVEAKGFYNIPIRIELIDSELDKEGKGVKLGTYGMIKGGKCYLVAALKPTENVYVELGYVLEQIILKATEMGLGTCWLGGTFDRKAFGEAMVLENDEIVAAATPIGKEGEKKRITEKLMRGLVGADNRKDWKELFFDETYGNPLKKEQVGKFGQVLEMVRLGPSASNKQPWRILKEGDSFHFYLEHTKNYPDSAQRMDMGIAMYHFESAAKELGLSGGFAESRPELRVPEHADYIITWKQEL